MIILAVLCILILFLSFIASSMEASLFTVRPVEIEQMVERKHPGARRLKNNKEEIDDSIIAIVILNNLSNITGSIVVGTMAVRLFDQLWVGIFSAMLTFAIILLGEVVPKTIGERNAASYARKTAGIVYFLRVILKPLIVLIKVVSRPLQGKSIEQKPVAEDEITILAGMGHREGSILPAENKLIQNIFRLDDILARDIMTPRTVVFALQADVLLESIAAELYEGSASRIPIYGEDLDDILGIAHIRILLAALARGKGETALREYVNEVSFVPDTARVNTLLEEFQRIREHLAIVVDEHGGMAGVISLEDILEQLVGEIVDEHDRDVDLRAKAKMLMEQKRSRGKQL